jgi:hypothetical protein
MIYFREYYIFANVLVFIYINRLRVTYPEFYTTDIFRDFNIGQNAARSSGGQLSSLPRIKKLKINNKMVLNQSNDSSFGSINSNNQYMILNPDDIEVKNKNQFYQEMRDDAKM